MGGGDGDGAGRVGKEEGRGSIEAVTLYFDPHLERHMQHGPFIGLGIAWYLAPQDHALALELYEAVRDTLGWTGGGGEGGVSLMPGGLMLNVLGLVLAQEFGDMAGTRAEKRR